MRIARPRALALPNTNGLVRVQNASRLQLALKLYREDIGVKLLSEFAAIGTLVLLFLSPPSVLGLGRTTQHAETAPAAAQSLSPHLPKLPSPSGVALERAAFASSSASLQPILDRAADALTQRNGERARAILRDADASDRNVMLLNALARLGVGGLGAIEESIALLKRASHAGQPQAGVYLGLIYLVPIPGFPTDKTEGITWLEKAAVQGRGEAARLLGQAFADGVSGAIDLPRAARYLTRGVELGDAPSAVYLGLMRLTGVGTGKDPVEAERLFHTAAEQGDGKAWAILGGLALSRYAAGWSTDESSVIDKFERALAAGEIEAAYPLGLFLAEQIRDPAKRDPQRAVGFFRRCAEAAIAPCWFAYATALDLGIGTPRDPASAYAYYLASERHIGQKATTRLANLKPTLTKEQLAEAGRKVPAVEAGFRAGPGASAGGARADR